MKVVQIYTEKIWFQIWMTVELSEYVTCLEGKKIHKKSIKYISYVIRNDKVDRWELDAE